jgi:formiminoglutamase
MEKIVPFTINDLAKITNHRSGEIKFGEKMVTIPKGVDPAAFLNTSEAKYVLFGIPEDIVVGPEPPRLGKAP